MAAKQSTKRGSATSNGLRPPVSLVRMSRGNEAAQYIRALIFDGELTPGSRVPQDEVAAVLGVSRIPVREALITLAGEGWVTIELNRGAFVNGFDANSVRDHYELFGMIYGFAARRALQRSPGPELADRLADVVSRAAGERDLERFTQLSLEFHRLILDAADSRRIKTMMRGIGQLVPGVFFVLVPQAVAVQMRGMRAVARACRKADADRAAAEYQKLMQGIGEIVYGVFDERGLLMPADGAGSARARPS